MTDVQTNLTKDDLIETQRVVADHTLKSDKGFTILNHLHANCARLFMDTQAFVFPVLNNIDNIKAELNDPDAFQKSFSTLLGDLKTMKDSLDSTLAQHQGRSGKPTPAEWPIMFDASLNYNNIVHHYETVVHPLMMNLISVLEEEYPSMVSGTATA